MGHEAIIINNNPETVSTDFDTSDRLYFDPLTLESVLEILLREQMDGILLQFGGQTAINLALIKGQLDHLEEMGISLKMAGTSPDSVDEARTGIGSRILLGGTISGCHEGLQPSTPKQFEPLPRP